MFILQAIPDPVVAAFHEPDRRSVASSICHSAETLTVTGGADYLSVFRQAKSMRAQIDWAAEWNIPLEAVQIIRELLPVFESRLEHPEINRLTLNILSAGHKIVNRLIAPVDLLTPIEAQSLDKAEGLLRELIVLLEKLRRLPSLHRQALPIAEQTDYFLTACWQVVDKRLLDPRPESLRLATELVEEMTRLFWEYCRDPGIPARAPSLIGRQTRIGFESARGSPPADAAAASARIDKMLEQNVRFYHPDAAKRWPGLVQLDPRVAAAEAKFVLRGFIRAVRWYRDHRMTEKRLAAQRAMMEFYAARAAEEPALRQIMPRIPDALRVTEMLGRIARECADSGMKVRSRTTPAGQDLLRKRSG